MESRDEKDRPHTTSAATSNGRIDVCAWDCGFALMPAGRPSDYDPAYCERVIELGDQGASVAEMAYELGACVNTLDNWAVAYPEFLTAFTRGKLASQIWWERKGRDALDKPVFQAGVWSRSMAARFPADWREVKGTEHSGGVAVTTKEQRDATVETFSRADT